MSPVARSYLTQLLDVMQANSVNRKTIDWPTFRQTVIGVESNAQTIQDLYPRIRAALSLLNDHHSFYVGPDSTSISSPPLAGCTEAPPPAVQVPEGIGYVKVGSFAGRSSAETAFAQAIHDVIGAADGTKVTGWIVDVRNNGGGNMWPMVAGLGPILGDGTAGGFVDADGGITWWGYRDSRFDSTTGSPLVDCHQSLSSVTAEPAQSRFSPIAGSRAPERRWSSVFGRGGMRAASALRPAVLSTSNEEFTLTGGGTLVLTVSTMTDRTGRPYGGAVAPDETIADPVETVRRALEWLRQ